MPLATFSRMTQVRFVDTDASGTVHFSSYVRMMEETEYAFLRSRGLSVVLPDERGVMGFPRLSANFQITQPLRFEQKIEINLQLVELDGKQIVYDFEIVTQKHDVAVTGRFVVAVCRFPDNAPPYAVLIPAEVEAKLTSN